MVGTKITCQRDEWHKNNSPNGWADLELNDRLENNSPNQWTDAELNGRLENNSPNRWTGGESNGGSKITHQMDG